MQQKIIILDFGSQTTQLIGRRVRELDTFCEIMPYNKFPKDDPSVIGVILSGSPYSVHDPEAFKVDLSQFVGRLPVLGICYGAQFISHTLGGKVEKADSREYGRAHLETINLDNPLFKASTKAHRYGCRMVTPSLLFLMASSVSHRQQMSSLPLIGVRPLPTSPA